MHLPHNLTRIPFPSPPHHHHQILITNLTFIFSLLSPSLKSHKTHFPSQPPWLYKQSKNKKNKNQIELEATGDGASETSSQNPPSQTLHPTEPHSPKHAHVSKTVSSTARPTHSSSSSFEKPAKTACASASHGGTFSGSVSAL